MRLVIVRDDGTVETVIYDLSEYDLSKPIARAEVANFVREMVDSIKSEPAE